MQTLYRKYRSQSFARMLGQDVIVKVIRKQVALNRIGHAYLFAGPRGTGKTSMARLLAKAVNCKDIKDGDVCGKCNSCLAIEKGKFLDLIEIDAASNRGIDEIRRLREKVNFSPSEGDYKVYIIDEVHMLTKDAFNALLKTLEEPPEHVIFVLATTEPHKIPMTILSRCQRFNFRLASDDMILKKLEYICTKEGYKFSKEALYSLSKYAEGSFRDAESLLEKVLGGIGVLKNGKVDESDVNQVLGLAENKEIKEFIDKLLEKNMKKSLEIVDRVAASGIDLNQFIRQSLENLRELLLLRVSKKEGKFSLSDIVGAISELSSAQGRLSHASIERLPIEVAIIKFCSQGEECERKNETKKAVPKAKIGKKLTNAISEIPKILKPSLKDKKGNQNVSIEQVKTNWSKIVDKIRPFNHHLSAFFVKATPRKLSSGKLLLQVPFRFHKQRIESPKAQEAFAKITAEILGQPLGCLCEVNENVSSDQKLAKGGNGNIVLEVLGDLFS